MVTKVIKLIILWILLVGVTLLVLQELSAPTHAALDPYLSYQGRLSDQNGNLLTGNYYITFCLYASASPATACSPAASPAVGAVSTLNSALWGETAYFATTNSPDNHLINGVFNAKLGSAAAFPANLFSANSQLYLGVNIYNGASWDGQMSPLQEIVSAGYALNAGQLSGYSASQSPGASQIPVLDASGNLTLPTGTKNLFSAAPTSTTQYGLLNIGSGGFGGAAGNFTGSASGTQLAINAASSFGGNLIDLEENGTSALSIDHVGNLTTAGVLQSNAGNGVNYVDYDLSVNNGNLALSATSNPAAAPTLGTNATGALGATTYYVKYSWTTNHGETLASPEASLAVAANKVLTVTIPSFPISVNGANIYVSNTAGGGSGAETKQGSIASSGGTWTEPISGLVAGSSLPFQNSAGGSLVISNGTTSASLYHISNTLTLDNSNSGAAAGFLLANSAGFFEFNPNAGPSSENLINSRTQSGGGAKSLYITGNGSGSAIPTLTLNATSTVFTGNDNVLSSAASATSNYGVLSIGSGGFGGAGGNFSGSSSGTQLAINAPSGFSGTLANFQTNGVSQWRLDASGNMTGLGNDNLFSASANAGANYGVLNIGAGGFGGGAGNFAGSSSGTLLAVNAAANFTGNLADLQANGTSLVKIAATGNTTIANANLTVTPLANPSNGPGLGQSAGGALGAVTYYAQYTWVNADGETETSPETSKAVAANTVLTVTVAAFPTTVTAAKVYVGTSSGAETLQATIGSSGGTWTEPSSGLVAGTSPPGANAAGGTILTNTLSIAGNYQGWSGLYLNNTNAAGSAAPAIAFQLNGTTKRLISVTLGSNPTVSFQSSTGVNLDTFDNNGYITLSGQSTSGTLLTLNAAAGFTGNLLDAQVNGSSKLSLDQAGNLTVLGDITSHGTSNKVPYIIGSTLPGNIVQGGRWFTGLIAAGSEVSTSITLSTPYSSSSSYYVYVTQDFNSVAQSNVTAFSTSESATGFAIIVANNGASAVQLSVNWLAIGS